MLEEHIAQVRAALVALHVELPLQRKCNVTLVRAGEGREQGDRIGYTSSPSEPEKLSAEKLDVCVRYRRLNFAPTQLFDEFMIFFGI